MVFSYVSFQIFLLFLFHVLFHVLFLAQLHLRPTPHHLRPLLVVMVVVILRHR